MEYAIDGLIESIKNKKSPIVIGLDPVYEKIPAVIRRKHTSDVKGAAEAILEFNKWIIDSVYDLTPAVKPQSAFYEQYGWHGIKALEESISYAKEKDLFVVEDAKRGDIGTTSRVYAEAHLGRPLADGRPAIDSGVDFLTVSPFLGIEGLEPFLDVAESNKKGIFVLVRTSNPDSFLVQSAVTESGKTVAEELSSYIACNSARCKGLSGYSSIGAVVGATYPEEADFFRSIMEDSFFLVPGYGTQGGVASDMVRFFNEDGLGALISASRSIIYAYENEFGQECSADEFRSATRSAAQKMREDMYAVLCSSIPRLG